MVAIVRMRPHVTMDKRHIRFPEMTVADVDLRAIPHCLSMICRFNGFVRFFYSVAQHSCLACQLAEVDHGEGSQIARMALFHDASEAYLGDVASPLKEILPDYQEVEAHVEAVVGEALGLPSRKENPTSWEEVKRYDKIAVNLEARALMFDPDADWIKPVEKKYHEVSLAEALENGATYFPTRAEWLMRTFMITYGVEVK